MIAAVTRDGAGVVTGTPTLTFLDRLASERAVTRTLNQPWLIEGRVPSESPEINILHTDGEPFLSYNDRLVFGFRREQPTSGVPWVCRASGILMQPHDEAATEIGYTRYVAYDPWQYLQSRPVVTGTGTLPPPDGLTYRDKRASQIIPDLLANAEAAHGAMFIDYGQTAYYTGTIESTDVLVGATNFAQALSLGAALDQLVATNTVDIVLRPIYDPINRPGLIAELSIYVEAGTDNYGAIFAWDMPSRSLAAIDRLEDGASMANKIQFYVGQGGAPVALQSAAAQVQKYGQWWYQQFPVSQGGHREFVETLALAELELRKRGKRTITITPAPEFSPVPFLDYDVGDRLPVYASARFRKLLAPDMTNATTFHDTALRAHAIPLVIGDDSVEAASGMLLARQDEQA